MSFSKTILTETRDEATAAVASYMAEVVARDPLMTSAAPIVEQLAADLIGTLDDDDTKNVQVILSGSQTESWAASGPTGKVARADVSLQVSVVSKA